jgi:uncharacterized protein YbbC (DUF1343 family)
LSTSVIRNLISGMKYFILIAVSLAISCASGVRYNLPSEEKSHVETGLEVFLENNASKYKGKKAAIATNPTGVDRSLNSNITLLEKAGININLIIAPEHGLFGYTDWPEKPKDENSLSKKRGIIHIQSMTPDQVRKALKGFDIVIFDIQDMGMRCYTYISDLACLIDALDKTGIELIVLDRPNPLSAYGIDGIMLDAKLKNRTTGYFPSTLSYGLTPGEAARYYKDFSKRNIKLNVIPMKGYSRDLYYTETSLPWVPPSPNLPSYKSAVIYSAAVYFEGTNLSVGRGTPNPFEYIGAPWIDAGKFASELKNLNLKGFAFRPVYFKPSTAKYSGKRCGGVQIFLTGESFSAFENAYKIAALLKQSYTKFNWQIDSDGEYGIDILSGNSKFRTYADAGKSFNELKKSTDKETKIFAEKSEKYYLY